MKRNRGNGVLGTDMGARVRRRVGYCPLIILLVVLSLTFGPVAKADGQSNGDPFVRWLELRAFTDKWLRDGNTPGGWRISSGPDANGIVNFFDFAVFAQNWHTQKVYSVSYNPYQSVDWRTWHRALAQHHDHMGRLSWSRIKAYDDAGYNVIVPLDYAGKRSAGTIYCTYRLWPVYQFLRGYNSDEEVLADLTNIKLFVPSMEEIGQHHMTSPFLTTYIELYEPGFCPTKEPWHYETTQECIDLINLYGGMPIIAHPYRSVDTYLALRDFKGIEIVSAYYYHLWLEQQGEHGAVNYIERFHAVWDRLLTDKDTKIWGFAVNDWYGPWAGSDEPYIDSGKIIVLTPDYTMEQYRASLEKGAFFAIYDWATPRANKNKYPTINEIVIDANRIFLDTSAHVTWIANGDTVAFGNTLDLSTLLPEKAYKYVRAEVSNSLGTVFTQPWTLSFRPKWQLDNASGTD